MKYIVLDKFTNSLVTDEDGKVLEFDSYINAGLEACDCQDGHFIPLNTERLFTKAEILDVLISFAQSMCPKEFNSSKELYPEDFNDVPVCKAIQLKLKDEFDKAVKIYANADDMFLKNYTPNSLL